MGLGSLKLENPVFVMYKRFSNGAYLFDFF